MTMTDYARRYAAQLDLIDDVRQSMTCDCWLPDEVEFHPTYTCPKCRIGRILESKP
jgi:hypothetical protein